MPRYEYKTFLSINPEEELNELGRQGWRLLTTAVAVAWIAEYGYWYTSYYIMERVCEE
ncbi:hypothetical protein IR083_20905 [Dysgonomonas sp. GY75]|uniref:hypothetical protein n=1 Tax=Dysgonomonas sp. GY75 TaxID=2780419 RepID=UPI0018845273|nr:hypothetical protein [Dysgonomonas sp. GY75]MBF0651282.1 hypothetical protein [Dysgonomonas sp. GY75]